MPNYMSLVKAEINEMDMNQWHDLMINCSNVLGKGVSKTGPGDRYVVHVYAAMKVLCDAFE